jgi:hypothetical protein
MKKLAAVLVVMAALALAPTVFAAGGISTTTTTVASGASFTVKVCLAAASDGGGYLVVKGPNTFSQDVFFGPAAGCSDVSVTTVGWPAGKYRITGFEFIPKGTKSLGAITITVT